VRVEKAPAALPRVPTSAQLEALLQGENSLSAAEFPVRVEKAPAGFPRVDTVQFEEAVKNEDAVDVTLELDALLEREAAPTSVGAFPGSSCWKVTAGALPVSDVQGPSPQVEVGGILELLEPEALPSSLQSELARMPSLSRVVLVNGYRYGFLVPEEVNNVLHRGQAMIQPCC
jgi:hypothetical protein